MIVAELQTVQKRSSSNRFADNAHTIVAFNPCHPSVAFQIETSHLVCNVNQMPGFYMKCNAGLKWVTINVTYPFS